MLYVNFPHITPNTHFLRNISVYSETFPITLQVTVLCRIIIGVLMFLKSHRVADTKLGYTSSL